MEKKSNLKYRIYHLMFVLYVLACIAGGVYIAMKSQADYEQRQAAQQENTVKDVSADSPKRVTESKKSPHSASEENTKKETMAFPPQVPTLTPQKKAVADKVQTEETPTKNNGNHKALESSNSGVEKIDLELHRKIVKKLQDKIKTQEITINDLEKTVDSLKRNMKSDLVKLKKPVSKFVAECYGMEVGAWKVDSQCIRSAQKTIMRMAKKYAGIIAWEVLPVVDSRPYKGLSPELKQEGLASFRAQAGIKLIQDTLEKEVVAFKGMTIKEEVKRGFVIKVHYLK